MTHPENRTEDEARNIIHAEGVFAPGEWGGIIIHAGGVRGDFHHPRRRRVSRVVSRWVLSERSVACDLVA
jgi:hypothetical protein